VEANLFLAPGEGSETGRKETEPPATDAAVLPRALDLLRKG
jgi:hypothetical protein